MGTSEGIRPSQIGSRISSAKLGWWQKQRFVHARNTQRFKKISQVTNDLFWTNLWQRLQYWKHFSLRRMNKLSQLYIHVLSQPLSHAFLYFQNTWNCFLVNSVHCTLNFWMHFGRTHKVNSLLYINQKLSWDKIQ